MENLRIKQINKALDLIHTRFDSPLSVKELADAAGMSPFHFHRVFAAVTGQSPARYIARRRMELAAGLLSGDDSLYVGEIALKCGFNSSNVFCRHFRRHFGISPGQYRSTIQLPESRIGTSDSTGGTSSRKYFPYFCSRKTLKTGGKIMECIFEIKEMPLLDIVYCRHRGPFDKMEEAFTRLMQWAYPRGLVSAEGMKLLSIYHDDPRITDPEHLTADAAMTVREKTKTDTPIGSYRIPAGRYAVGRFEIGMEDFPSAWNAMFVLLAEHGCRCTQGHHYEIYQGRPDEHPQGKWTVDICIPVEPK